jgi:methyl-accepting chemotaxis protein
MLELLLDVETVMAADMSTVMNGMEQTHGIVSDAIAKMSESFNGLHQQSRTQHELVRALIENLAGSAAGAGAKHVSMQEFTKETGKVLERYVESAAKASRGSSEIVRKIDAMSGQMTSIFSLLANIESIARQTNLLALNASIEAARAGDAGRGFAVVAGEVRRLSSSSKELSEQIGDQVSKARAMVTEARRIVSEAAAEDTEAAMDAQCRVGTMMKELNEVDAYVEKNLQDVSTISSRLNQDIALAVRALQFEDIVRQLIIYNKERLQRLQECFAAVRHGVENAKAAAPSSARQLQDRIRGLRGEVAAMTASWSRHEHKPVQQESMSEGDIELF